MDSSIFASIISIVSLVCAIIALVMNRLATFRRYRISHNVVHYYNVPGVDPEEAFIGIEVLNTGYHPITIVEIGFFDNRSNKNCVPLIGVPGAELPKTISPGTSTTFPISINEIKKNTISKEDIKTIYVRDSIDRYKKQSFKSEKFSNEFQ